MIARDELTRQAMAYMRLKSTRNIATAEGDILVHCPFHKDNTPSMSINISNGIFHCFSCHRSGSIEKMFKEYTGESLYKVLNISFDEFSKLAIPTVEFQDPTHLDIDSIHIDYNPMLLQSCRHSVAAKQFLRKRSIPFSVVDAHNIRFAEKIYINNPRKPYINVILIPIYEQGKLISMEIRSTDPDAPKADKVRYPRGASVNTLYDLDHLDKKKPLYVTEGLMDLLVLRKYPQFANSSTIFGSAVTHRQKALLQGFDSVVYIPDNDKAGDATVQWFADNNMTNVSILYAPKEINGVAIKDVGDVEGRSGSSIKALLDRKWLAHIRQLNIQQK